MILGEAELTGYRLANGDETSGNEKSTDATDNAWVSARTVRDDVDTATGRAVQAVKLSADQVSKKGSDFFLTHNPQIIVESRAFKMSKSRGNVINPATVVDDYQAHSL